MHQGFRRDVTVEIYLKVENSVFDSRHLCWLAQFTYETERANPRVDRRETTKPTSLSRNINLRRFLYCRIDPATHVAKVTPSSHLARQRTRHVHLGRIVL